MTTNAILRRLVVVPRLCSRTEKLYSVGCLHLMMHSHRHRRWVDAPVAAVRWTILCDFSGRISMRSKNSEIDHGISRNRLEWDLRGTGLFWKHLWLLRRNSSATIDSCSLRAPDWHGNVNENHSRWHFKPNKGERARNWDFPVPSLLKSALHRIPTRYVFFSTGLIRNWSRMRMHTTPTHTIDLLYGNSQRQNDRWLTQRNWHQLQATHTCTRQPHTCLNLHVQLALTFVRFIQFFS